jgi:hypothetical protein
MIDLAFSRQRVTVLMIEILAIASCLLGPLAAHASVANVPAGKSFTKYGVSQVYGTPVCPASLIPGESGCFFGVQWAAIEPQSGIYDFSIPDQEIAMAQKAGYPVELEIVTGEYGAPVSTSVCNSFKPKSGATPCMPWLGSGYTHGVAETNAVKDIGINQCTATWVPAPWDTTFQAALSGLEQTLYTHYSALSPNTVAMIRLATVSDNGDHIRVPWDGGPCGKNHAENWYNNAWQSLAKADKSITTESAWISEIRSDMDTVDLDLGMNLGGMNLGIGIAGGKNSSFPAIYTSSGGNVTPGKPEPALFTDVWTDITSMTLASGNGWVTYEALNNADNFELVVGPWTKPNTSWYGSGEDAHQFTIAEQACEAWELCSQPSAESLDMWSSNAKAYPTQVLQADAVISGTGLAMCKVKSCP